MRMTIRAPPFQDFAGKYKEVDRSLAYYLRDAIRDCMENWKSVCMLEIETGRMPNAPDMEGPEGGEIPASDYIRREARFALGMYSMDKGSPFLENQGKYAETKARGGLIIRGQSIPPTTQPLGVLTGGLWSGIVSARYRVYAGKYGVLWEFSIDDPFYFKTVHDGWEPRNIHPRPFVSAAWDTYIKYQVWIVMDRTIKSAMEIEDITKFNQEMQSISQWIRSKKQ
jgi:hypothetical protein